jgi:LysR family nitrogen assimilation transcriptional regulator
MDLRQISYFVAFFEEGSVTRAAKRVHVVTGAQHANRQARTRTRPRSCSNGRRKRWSRRRPRTLHRLVQPILRDLALAREQMARLSNTISGRVTIGVLFSLASSVVPSVLARFATAYPDVEVSMADGYSSTFIDEVNSGDLNLAIINEPMRKLGLVTHHLMDEEMVVVGGCDTVLPLQDAYSHARPRAPRIELDRHLDAETWRLRPSSNSTHRQVSRISSRRATGSRCFRVSRSVGACRTAR